MTQNDQIGTPVDKFLDRGKNVHLSREVIAASLFFDAVVKKARGAGLTVNITLDEENNLPNVSVMP